VSFGSDWQYYLFEVLSNTIIWICSTDGPKPIQDVRHMSMPEEEIVKRALDELHLRVSGSAKGELVPPIKALPNGNNVVNLKCTQGSVSYEVEIELTKRGKFIDLRTK
jgi:hypothetical protein